MLVRHGIAGFLLATAQLAGLTRATSAQATRGDPFGGIRALRCEFRAVATYDWQSEEPQPAVTTEPMDFVIDGIDAQAGSARMIGNAGATDLVLVRGVDVLSFIERTPAGNLMVTSIFFVPQAVRKRAGRELPEGSFEAVHSRHFSLITPFPSQRYGHCRRGG
ncbi:MAG: hypothetical protein IT352_04070 [Gemmatimonadales bacterium]|nr:hypothetical protein [Gemmatimonadales bacterium]